MATPTRPGTEAAMAKALRLFEAMGRAERVASDLTVPFNPVLAWVRGRLLLYAWATRQSPEDVAYLRELARRTVRAYRAWLAEQERKEAA